MKLKNKFILRTVMGETVVVPVGEASKVLHGMIKLNETGKIVWQGIEAGLDEEQIAKRLTDQYEISLEQARADTAALIQSIREAGFMEEG